MKKQSATKKRLKVKDMPRKQQMAVKATMAEQAAGKKSIAKKKTEAAKRLLKAVPNQKAYNKLSDEEKKSFNKAAKKAKLPMKKSPTLKLKTKTSPALAKLSASCKAAARRKFKVYPSAYANMWASRAQKKGKC